MYQQEDVTPLPPERQRREPAKGVNYRRTTQPDTFPRVRGQPKETTGVLGGGLFD